MKKKLVAFVAVAALIVSTFATPLTFTWDRSPEDQGTNNVTYAVYQATGTNAFVKIANTSTNVTLSTNIAPGLYRFYVVAIDFWGIESDPSNTLATPDPKKPTSPKQPILYVIVGSRTNIVVPLSQ